MLLKKLNKLFDDAFLYEDEIEEDEKGEFVTIYEVSDDLKKGLSYTADNYINTIEKVNDLTKNFIEEYSEYEKCEENKIHFYIFKNKYYINEERDDIIEMIEGKCLFWSEIKKER